MGLKDKRSIIKGTKRIVVIAILKLKYKLKFSLQSNVINIKSYIIQLNWQLIWNHTSKLIWFGNEKCYKKD